MLAELGDTLDRHVACLTHIQRRVAHVVGQCHVETQRSGVLDLAMEALVRCTVALVLTAHLLFTEPIRLPHH